MGVLDRYNTKKNEGSSNVAERYKRYSYYNTLNTDAVNENYVNTFISDANSFFENESISYNDAKSTVEDLSTRVDIIQGWLYKNRNNLGPESYSSLYSTFDGVRRSLNSQNDYYSQWDNETDYNAYIAGWLDDSAETNETTVAMRQAKYESNKSRIAEIESALPGIAKTFLPSSVEKLFISKENDALLDELDALKADNNKYTRTQGVLDEYYVPVTDEFTQNAAYRNYSNASRDELLDYDLSAIAGSEALNNGGSFDDAGNIVNSKGQIVQYANGPAVEDKLGMFLSATDDDIAEAYNMLSATNGNYTNTWANLIQEGDVNGWKYLTEYEVSIYYDLLKREGQEAAYQFLSDMATTLTKRETQKTTEWINNQSGLAQIGLNLASIPMNVFGGAVSFVDDAANIIQGEDINPYSRAHALQNAASDIRNNTAMEINEATGNAALPWVGTTWGDVYQSVMSAGDSALGAAMGGNAYGVLMGMGAASTEMKDLYESGASLGQIAAGGILAGAAEMVFEKYSIDNLVNMGDAKSIKAVIVNMLKQGGIEASEEMATEIANTITNVIVMGSQSDWVDMNTFAKNVVNAGIGGFISGVLSGGVGSAAKYGAYNKAATKYGQKVIDKGDVAELQDLAMEMAGVKGGLNAKAIGNLSKKVSSNATANRVGRLADLMVDTTEAQNKADIKAALESKGLSKKDAARVADYLYGATQGEMFTDEQAAEIENDDRIIQAYADLVGKSDSAVYARDQKLAHAINKESASVVAATEGIPTTEAKTVPDVHYEVSESGKMENTESGKEINPQGLVQAKDGTYLIADNDADPVSSDKVSYKDDSQALVYETFVNLEPLYGKTNKVIADMDLSSRNELLGLYNPTINKDGGKFVNGILDAFFYGHRGVDLSAASKDSPVWELTDQQRKVAWNTGRAAGIKTDTKVQGNVDTAYAEAKKILESGKAKKSGYNAVLQDGISPTELNNKQKAVYRYADEIAQGIQATIRVYKGETNEYGFYNHATEEIWLNLNAANTDREHIMAFALAHELVHRAKKGSYNKYQAFAAFLTKEYGKQGADLDAMIAEQMDAAERFNKTVPEAQRVNMTREKALEEVICDACQRMLLDTNAGQKLAEFGAQSKENKGFLEDLKRWITELLDKLRRYFRHAKPDSLAGKAFDRFDANVKQMLADMYVDMSIDAGEKLSTIKAAFGNDFASKFAGVRDIRYNLAAVDSHKTKLQKAYSEESSTDLKTLMARYDKIIEIWNRLGGELNSKFLADWNSKVGKDRTFTIFKAQTGYKYNVELSSMCKKGVPLFEAIDTIVKQEVMKELGTEVLGKAEKEILYDILKQHHFEIPCAICYVEQARQREGVIIDAFLNGKVEKNAKGETTKVKLGWNQVLDSIQKEMKANGVDYTFAQVSRDIATEKYSPANLDMDKKTQVAFYAALKKIANQEISRYNKAEGKNRKLLTDITPEAVKQCFKGTLPSNLKIFKVLFNEPSSRFKIQNDLLYSSIATQNLSMAHNELYGLFNSQGGVNGYKTKQGTTIYWGDILGKSWKPDTVRDEGGVRNQSNSDFQMYTLLDQAQMYIDFSAKGYYLQAYTKVLSELKLFGLSRGKINASLIPKVVVYYNADGSVDIEKTMSTAGLDENGNPIYDDIEGINHNEAFMLIEDPEYSKNICGICIGYSDAHINKLLEDNRVQQIIGFHDKTDDGTKRYKGARYAKNYNGLNEATKVDSEGKTKTVHIGFNSYVKRAEKKFQFNAETETFEGTVKYNGKTYTADDIPRLAADLYLEMCAKKEYTPAYKDFSGHRNYYKLLADFGLYDSQGHYAPHRKVAYNMPDTVPYLDANGKKQTMRTDAYIKSELEKELAVRDSIAAALADTSSEGIIPQFKAAVKKSQQEKSYSLPKGDPAPTFYSHMAKVVDGIKQEKLGAASVVSMLRGKGVKAEEIKWSGIEAWLEGKKSVTKAELQEFIAGSMLQIEEEVLDNKDRPYTEDQQNRLDEYEAKRDEVANRLADEWKKITGEEFPIRNTGAGLESAVVNKIIDENKDHKDASFEGRLLAKLRKDVQKVIENNDDFGFDSWKDALRSIHRHRRDFITHYEMTTNDKAIIVKYCNALNAYNELPNKFSDADTERLREIARETDPWNRKIMDVKNEHNEEEAKYMTNWKQYSLDGGKNYREMLFRIPGSTYTNEAMMTHWKERKGVLAHARVQDFDTFLGKMLFIEEIQSDWHNAGHKDGYRAPGVEDKYTLSQKMNKYTEEFFASPIADVVRERIGAIGYEGSGVSMILNFLLDSQDSMNSTLNTLSKKGASFTESEVSEIAKYAREYEEMYHKWETAPGDLTAPEAPFSDNYHEYVLKRLLREAAEQDYDSIGWTTAETQDDRWQNNMPHKEGTGKSGFLKAYTIEYDQDIPKFLNKYSKKWDTKVGKTVLDNGTEVWSMAITDSMKESVLYEGQVVYSLPKGDQAYMDAVNRGDMETAQRMVDEAAKKAGFPARLLHGTQQFGFTVADTSVSDDKLSFFATSDVDTARTYSSLGGKRGITEDADYDVIDEERVSHEENARDKASALADKISRWVGYYGYVDGNYIHQRFAEIANDYEADFITQDQADQQMYEFADDIIANGYSKDEYDGQEFWEWQESDEAEALYTEVNKTISAYFALAEFGSKAEYSGNYDLYANTDGLLVIEGNGAKWNDIKSDILPDITSDEYKKYGYRGHWDKWTTRSISKYASDNGYRGVLFKNIYDDGGKSSSAVRKPADVYSFFYPQEQVKSADPVTYDDNGNVIPLSKRFNVENDDIRYALPKTQNQPYRKPGYNKWEVEDALDDALKHADYGYENLIKVGNMPNFITDLIGIKGDFYIYRNHAYENMVSKKDAEKAHRPTVRGGKEIHFHNLGKDRMTDAILSLEAPIMTIADSEEFGNPEIVMILPVLGNNNSPLYAAMSFYSNTHINGEWKRKPHIVLTISERALESEGGYDGHLEVINKAIENGKVLSFDKEKMRDYLSVIANHTRVGNITSKSLTENITQFQKFVNNFREENHIDYKLPVDEDTSPRALLANAFEGLAQNDSERNKIQEYKEKVALINAEEQKLRELNEQIKELSFANGKRDTKKINALRFDANQASNRINTYDRQLLRLEASKPLQDVLAREKKLAYKKAEQRGKEALKAYREAERKRDEQWHSEVKEKYQASKAKAIETREKREAREKLQKLVIETVKWISYPAKTDVKCPDILKQPYADFLNGIDLSSKRLAEGGDPTKTDLRLANAMGSLATALDRIMTSQDPTQDTDKVLDTGYLDLPANFVAQLRDMTENIKAMMVDGDYVVNNMTAAEVRKLSQMIRTLNHAIKTMSNLYANLRFSNVEALGFDTMEFMDALGEIEKTSGMKDFVQWDNALPYYAFKRFGNGGESVFEGLMDAQDKLAFLAQKIFDFQEKTWTGEEAKAWSEDTHTIDLPNGDKLTLTTADAMSIYCLSRREQALPHLLGGGVRVMGIQKGSTKAKDSRSLLTIKDVEAIISSLTDRQKQVADGIQAFMSTVCSEWGNEISMKRFLTKEFTEKFYFPIESNDENLTVKDPAAQQSDLFRLLNISATKPLTQGANNEVIIRNVFDVFTGHASDMARLNAYGMALLDYMKWLNYREKAVNEEGQIKVRGVRKSMEKAYGKAANSYVLNLIKDVNGRASDGGDPTILMKWMRSAKTASVGSSLRVATLQLTSYPRAALVLSPKSLALGLTKLPQIEKAKKYCGIALWKSFGFYDTNISRSIEDQMKGVKDVKQKLIELSLKGAEWGDAITWGALWNACEYEVAKTTKNEVGSEEFYQEVGKKLREVVYRTQVVDSTLTRSQMMRSKRGMAQEAAAFMSEPTLSANILMDAGFQFSAEKRRTGSAKAAWAKTGKYIGKAVAVYSIGQLAAAFLESLWDAWRDDDDEEFGEKFADAFVENSILDLVPFNKIPIVSDVFEAALAMFDVGFYSSDKMSTTWLTQAVSAADAWKDVLSGNSSTTAYDALYKSVRALSSYYGVSFSGVMREGVALWNNTAGAYDATLKVLNYERSKGELGDLLLDAIIEGSDRQADSLRGEFADEEAYQSALRTAIKDRFDSSEIDYDTAIQYLVEYGGMEEDDAYWKVEEWKYEGETEEDFSKYNKFYEAVQTGKNLKIVIKEYTDNGVTKENLASQITKHFKPIYTEMTASERAGIKGYLLNAYEQCGVKREDATKKLQYWDFLSEQPDSDLTQYQVADYYEFAKPAGISSDLYAEYCGKVEGIEGENKKERRMAVINSMPITSAQKDALYYAEGWAESKIHEAPWH